MKLRLLSLISALSILLPVAISQSNAQTPRRDDRPRAASIGGQVTISGQPTANVTVRIVEIDPKTGGEFFSARESGAMRDPKTFKAVTDAGGRYHLAGLAVGTYRVSAASKAYVLANQNSDIEPAKQVTLDDDETREDVDLPLARGGVITGRVANSEGKPLIAARVWLFAVTRQGDQTDYRGLADQYHEMFQTDDRGVYRIYGLSAGRYILSAGGGERHTPVEHSARDYRRTYFRDAASRKTATIIEVKEGGEVTDVDIKLGDPRKTYEASGRLIEAETGKPIPQAHVWSTGYDREDGEESGTRDGRSVGAATDSQGNFRLTGLTPGKYEIGYSGSLGESEYYSDRTGFEVIDDNVEGLEVKAKRAATISGVAVIEGVVDPNLRTLLFTRDSINVDIVQVIANSRSISRGPITRIEPNGEFRVSISQRGKEWKVWFVANQWNVKGLRVLRVEHNGVEVKDGIEVSPGQQITGVRVVFTQARGVIRGQVKFVGALPENAEAQVVVTQASDDPTSSRRNYSTGGSADSKGRFVFEDLLPGEYEVRAHIRLRTGRNHFTSMAGLESSLQRVAVTNGQETPVELTIDLSKMNQKKPL